LYASPADLTRSTDQDGGLNFVVLDGMPSEVDLVAVVEHRQSNRTQPGSPYLEPDRH
jgi:hypothetical protein